MSQRQELYQTLHSLNEQLEIIDNEIFQGQACLSDRLIPYQSQENIIEIQAAIRDYQAQRSEIVNEIYSIQRLLF